MPFNEYKKEMKKTKLPREAEFWKEGVVHKVFSMFLEVKIVIIQEHVVTGVIKHFEGKMSKALFN